jgi:hypothetical protein
MSGQVVNVRISRCDVYIGRPSEWGNPFVIGEHGNREDVVRLYEEWIVNQPELMAKVGELHGKRLGCWCAPHACHGDVLLKLARQAVNDESN